MKVERFWRPYPVDPSCKLYLPFYRYGSEQSKIWDISGNNNHGTIVGAVPGTYPMLSGTELVSNGGFGSDTTGWEVFQNATLSSVAGGQSGNCLQVTNGALGITGIGQQASIPITIGKRYKFTGWHKKGNNNGWLYVGDSGNSTRYASWADISDANWAMYEVIFVAVQSDVQIRVRNMTTTENNYSLYDSFSIQEVTGYEGLGWSFDGSDDVVTITQSLSINFPDAAFTGIVWIWSIPKVGNWTILGKGTTDSNEELLLIGKGSEICFDWGGTSAYRRGGTLSFNKWQNIAFRYNGDTTGNIFLNGSEVSYSVQLNGVHNTGTFDLLVGNSRVGFGKINIGELLLFNRALSTQEVRDFFELTRSRYGI